MSEFFLAYPQAYIDATSTAASYETAANPHLNALQGGSTLRWYGGNLSLGNVYIQFNNPAAAKTYDVVIARCARDFIAAGATSITLTVENSPNNATYTQRGSSGALTSFHGPDSDDIVLTFTEASAKYWRARVYSSPAAWLSVRKLYLCKRFDFGGKAPRFPWASVDQPGGSGFTADSGSTFKSYRGKPGRAFSLRWFAVTDAAVLDFRQKILPYADLFPVYFVEPTSASFLPLGGARCILAWIMGANISAEGNGLNTVEIAFVEDRR